MPQSVMKRLICILLCISLVLGTAAFAENTVKNAAEYAPLEYEMKNSDEVRAMQKRLKQLDFFDSSATGGYYDQTAKAVEAFQKAAGLPVNGKYASSEMLELLFSDDAPGVEKAEATEAVVFTSEPAAQTEAVLTYGMKDNAAVRQAQKRLRELDYLDSSITGNFFGATQAAFEAFQQKVGLPVNGKAIDQATIDALYSESAPAANSNPEIAITPMPTATPKPVYTAKPDATPRPALYYGDTSDAIKEMQKRLKELKYLDASATGGYWGATEKAVEAFQKDMGLPVNGRVASTKMLAKLFEDQTPVKPGEEEPPVELTRLYFGQSGNEQIRAMQDRLTELGYFKSVATGGYYLNTADAVAEFQRAIGFPVNKYVASVELQQRLYASDAPAYDPNRPLPTTMPTATPAPTATVIPEPTATSAPTMPPLFNAAPTAAPTAEPYAELKYGMSDSEDVYKMQARLKELGYLKADPTGGYWSATVKAVKNFLKDAGLEGDGKTATVQMQTLLFAGIADEPEADEPEADEAIQYETLTYAMESNAAVKAVQNRLHALGYFDESATGNYYSLTADAVEAFQQAAGLPVDRNTITPEMQALLFSANAPTVNGDPLPDETAQPTLPPIDTGYKALKYGMENSEEVRAMQKKLKERGFFSSNCTGSYYDVTRKAVAAFQTYAGLPVNGKEASSTMLGYLYYTGDLDQLIASGATPPAADEPVEFDPVKYQNAQTNTLLSKGMKGEQVNFLIMRLCELNYLNDCSPTSFDSDVAEAVKWFQNTHRLDSDGIAGPRTLEVLYSAKAMSADESMKDNTSSGNPTEVEGEKVEVSIGTVLNVDWFSDEGDKYYNRRTGLMRDGTTVIITDVDSGLSFRAKRSGGYNHADMEPLTAYDTWVMYQIYDEEWSWKRHAIYVTLESGTSIAASMNGMPHGSGSISGNNFDGHFCVHFLNSRTHGTDRVDPDHQAAVKKAANR